MLVEPSHSTYRPNDFQGSLLYQSIRFPTLRLAVFKYRLRGLYARFCLNARWRGHIVDSKMEITPHSVTAMC